jgi:hypothetical protein
MQQPTPKSVVSTQALSLPPDLLGAITALAVTALASTAAWADTPLTVGQTWYGNWKVERTA